MDQEIHIGGQQGGQVCFRSVLSRPGLIHVGCFGCQQLTGNVSRHPAHPRNDLIAEKRVIVLGEEVTEDGPDRAQDDVPVRKLFTEHCFHWHFICRISGDIVHHPALA
jgi:hypothetical protein